MTTYVTADLHLGHRKVSEIRGFVSTDEHDAAILDAWRSAVNPRDTVWILGDLAVSSPARALELISELPGTKHLVSGNHDRCHPMHRDSCRWQSRYLSAFSSVQPYVRQKFVGVELLMCHFPYAGDHTAEDRYTQYRLPDRGLPLLHGHTHLSSQMSETGLQIHVGWDAWHGLVSVERVVSVLMP